MQLIEEFGERWARNSKNMTDKHLFEKGKNRQGVYILYDGSTPVYIGKGDIQARIKTMV